MSTTRLQYVAVLKSNIGIGHCLTKSLHHLPKSTVVRTATVHVELSTKTTLLLLLQLQAKVAYLQEFLPVCYLILHVPPLIKLGQLSIVLLQ